MARLTPASQRNGVSEGVALGLLLSGHSSVIYDKLRVDLAFSRALRGWAYRDQFPQVMTDVNKGLDGLRVLTHASQQRKTACLYWARGGPVLEIVTRQLDLDLQDEADLEFATSVVDGDVPLDGWTGLAEEFLRRVGV